MPSPSLRDQQTHRGAGPSVPSYDPLEELRTILSDGSPEELSQSTSDPISRLPFELATTCFRLLGLRGRFAVSQVSRAWRRTALSDCCLWNSLQTSTTRRYGPAVLQTLLARSGGLPFDFSWVSSAAIPDAVLDVLAQNMVRMGTLTYWGASERLLQHSAPVLRHLALHDLCVALPADWARSVPCLEVLQLGVFSIPADFQPLPALTSFCGCLAAGSSGPVLAHVFPRLVTLHLEGVTHATLWALGAPPPSCRSVVLRSQWGSVAAVDYAPFERACRRLRIPHIVLSSAVSVAAAAEEFARATRGECSMVVRNTSRLTLESKADGVRRIVDSAAPLPFVAEVGGFAHLNRLTDLALPLALLLGIFRRRAPPETFSALRTLRLALAPEDVDRTASIPYHNGDPPLVTPRLAEVVLEVYELDHARDESAYYRSYNPRNREHRAWFLCDWPDVLPAVVTFVEGRLATLTVVMSSRLDAVDFAEKGFLECFRDLAETLHVTHRSAFFHSEDPDDCMQDQDDDDFDEY